ncbi:hypothetical protein ACFW16_33950 [Inquilinus sp. NPDC058860]|uniref:hypothetical protein n=1 Tax=Inquilinus sp. NPDC058860 TaxID=3346652 RepID=UPI0036AF0FC5
MKVRFFDRQNDGNPKNGAMIETKEDLAKLLSGIDLDRSVFCELIGENGYNLLIGLSKDRGCAQHSRADGELPYLMAVSNQKAISDECFEFLLGGTPTPVPSRYCMPIDAVKKIACYFQSVGGICPDFSWEEV